MRRFLEKLIIVSFCLYNSYKINSHENLAIYFLISLVISLALDLINDKKTRTIIYFIFIIMCFSNSLFIVYLPLILYNIYLDFGIFTIFTFPLILMNFSIANLLLSIVAVYLSSITKAYNLLLNENKTVRDELKEDTFYLEKYTYCHTHWEKQNCKRTSRFYWTCNK